MHESPVSPASVIKAITTRLQDSLGDRYWVIDPTSDAHGNPELLGQADVLVQDRMTGKTILLEVKGSTPADALPLGMVPYLRHVKQSNADSEVVLVSTSRVSPLVERSMAESAIHVVEARPGQDVVPALSAAIERAVAGSAVNGIY